MIFKSQQTRSEKDPFKSDTCRTRKEQSKRKLPAGKIFCGLKERSFETNKPCLVLGS